MIKYFNILEYIIIYGKWVKVGIRNNILLNKCDNPNK